MKTKEVALVIGFTALAVALNPAVSHIGLAFPPLQTLFLNIWEIPVITLFLLIGFKPGISVAALNALFLFSVYPGPTNPSLAGGSIVSATSMMVGIYLLLKFKRTNDKTPSPPSGKATVIFATLSAVVMRVLWMAPIGYAVTRLTVPALPDRAIFLYVLPWQAAYNVIQPFITIPAAFFIARLISNNLNFGAKLVSP